MRLIPKLVLATLKGILHSQRIRDALLDDKHEFSCFTRLGDSSGVLCLNSDLVALTPDVTLQLVEGKCALTVGKNSLNR